MHTRTARDRQGGFSVIIVLILLILLVGIAMILLSTSRGDIFAAANERETAIAFYAAEAGLAHGKAVMSAYTQYSETAKFTGLVGQPAITKTIDYQLPNGVTVPASYTVTFQHNADGADGGIDLDGMLVIHSVGAGPNNARAVVEAGFEVRYLGLAASGAFVRFDAITMTRLLGGWVGEKTLVEMASTNQYFRRGCLGALALARVHDQHDDLGFRDGDGAQMAIVELIGSRVQPLFGVLPDPPMEQVRTADLATTSAVLGWPVWLALPASAAVGTSGRDATV